MNVAVVYQVVGEPKPLARMSSRPIDQLYGGRGVTTMDGMNWRAVLTQFDADKKGHLTATVFLAPTPF